MEDEITVNKGDDVSILGQYLDGWCFGMNRTTNMTGALPVGCLAPLIRTKFIVVNIQDHFSSPMGGDLVEAACLSFPKQIQEHRFDVVTLSAEKLSTILDFDSENAKAIVCAGVLNGKITDLLHELQSPLAGNMEVLAQ